MIKLIASDIDGTLIRSNDIEDINYISPRTFNLIEQCMAKGIRFAVASGRQYSNMKRLFAPIWKDIYFISENGAVIFRDNEIQHMVAFPNALVPELVKFLKEVPGTIFQAASPYIAFIPPEPEWFVDYVVKSVRYSTVVIDDMDYVKNEDIIKMSLFVLDPKNAHNVVKQVDEVWGDQFNVTKSGKNWVDITLTGKGASVRRIADDYGISKDEIMVFGDNYNDVELFASAEHSFCMASSDEYLQSQAKYVTHTVEDVLEHYLETGEIKGF